MEMSDYRVRFTAVAEEPLGADAAARLRAVLENMPGAGRVEGAEQDDRARRVSAGFWIEVRLGMADAARDGSRLAKEALKGAGMAEAQLVELSVWLGAADRDPGGR
jgi:hypothetical protein